MSFISKDNYLKNINFVKSVSELSQLPTDDMPEICVIGRSNVGKSSLINLLSNHGSLAKTSKAAGCTRLVNFFNVNNQFYLVDLPGYGYAKAAKKMVRGWNDLIITFLKGSKRLVRVFLLIDSRHGFKENDIEVMTMMDDMGLSYQIVLTKVDKINKYEMEDHQENFKSMLKKHSAMNHEMLATSSYDKIGIKEFLEAVQLLFGVKS
jgi:GTP-binding protein